MAQMAGQHRFDEISPGAESGTDIGRNQDRTGPGGRLADRGRNTAIENWLALHLRQLYLEVCSEPLPSELSEMIDRFRSRRQDDEAGHEKVAPLTPTARQSS